MAAPTPTSPEFDLTTESGVQRYLNGTPFSCTKVEALTGGYVNFIFRLHLSEPYDGKQTLVLKHAQPYMRTTTSAALDIRRQYFEVEAIKRVQEWSHQADFVTVPNIYKYDDSMNVIIMEDSGPNSLALKEYIQLGKCSIETAHKLGKSIGGFLGKLHSWGNGNRQVCEFFDGNQQTKELMSWATYGKVLSTFEEKLEKLQDPPLALAIEESAMLKKISEEIGNALSNATEAIVMGDFWPDNLALSFKDTGEVDRILVLDWEMCRPGLFSIELGMFCAELHLLAQFNADLCEHAARTLLEDFLRAYGTHITPDLLTCRRTIVHLGAYMIVWTPRMEWGGKEMTQKVVREGIELMVKGYSADSDWLRSSLIGPLTMNNM